MTTYPKSSEARERLISAAARVFGLKGLQGATTREIAREAGVNELTLFRHFHSKANLLATVLHHAAEDQAQVRVRMDAGDRDLLSGLLTFARAFNEMLESHEGLIRTLIGEVHRDPASARQVTDGAFAPWRESLTGYLRSWQSTGEIMPTWALAPMVDNFIGMLLSGMLRRTCPWATREYTTDEYLQTSVGIFVRGVSFSSNRSAPSVTSSES